MKIGLNLLYLIPGVVGGVQTYAEGLLSGLARHDDGNEYFVVLNREAAALPLPDSPRFHRVVMPVAAESRVKRYLWEQCRLPGFAQREGLQLLHSLAYVGPLAAPCATVVTVHDLNFLRLARQMPVHRRLGLGYFSKKAAARADQIITVSEFSKQELCSDLGLNPTRVSVVHHGTPEGGCDLVPSEGPEALPDLPFRYIVVFTGGGAAHKNISSLMQAFRSLCHDLPHRLVLIGRLRPSDAIHLNDKMIPLGYLSAKAVRHVLRGAELFVLPSLYEGFGFPILEAQGLGVPVACSSAASLPEVGGQSAGYFSPHSVEMMAATIRSILRDRDRRDRLVAGGYENVNRFSWDKAARLTTEIYATAHARWAHRHQKFAGHCDR